MDIDKLILEKIMGYTHLVGKEVPEHARHMGEPEDDQEVWIKDKSDRFCKYCGDMLAYSTNIADAFEVVEKIGGCLHLRQHGKEGNWAAMFCDSMVTEVNADTAPMAICLAALKAIK